MKVHLALRSRAERLRLRGCDLGAESVDIGLRLLL